MFGLLRSETLCKHQNKSLQANKIIKHQASVCVKYRREKVLSRFINEPHHEKTCLCHMRTTKAQISLASVGIWAGRFESYLVANTEDRFSRDVAQMILIWISLASVCIWAGRFGKGRDYSPHGESEDNLLTPEVCALDNTVPLPSPTEGLERTRQQIHTCDKGDKMQFSQCNWWK